MRFPFQIALLCVITSLTLCARAHAKEPDGPIAIAVLYFDNNTGDKSLDPLSRGFADMLITDLSGSEAVQVVERGRLEEVIKEAKLQRSRYFSAKTAVKMGRGLGAKYVVAGAFAAATPKLRIDARLIDVASGKVIHATKAVGKSDQVFELEQELVAGLLGKLKLAYLPEPLPRTKVPNLKILLKYSEGLVHVDAGQDEEAAALMQSVVRMAPAFAMARTQHEQILRRLSASVAKREETVNQIAGDLFANAQKYFDRHSKGASFQSLTQDEAEVFLGYRNVQGAQLDFVLHQLLHGTTAQKRFAHQEDRKQAIALLRSRYDNYRQQIEEERLARAAHSGAFFAELPEEDEDRADALGIEVRSENELDLLEFLLDGRARAPGNIGFYRIHPAPADLDAKLEKAAMKVAEQVFARKDKSAEVKIVRARQTIAEWHLARGRPEQAIASYQAILDQFPANSHFARFERKIKEILGLEHDYLQSKRIAYAKSLQTCRHNDFAPSFYQVLEERMRTLGSAGAFRNMERELINACKGKEDLRKMRERFYESTLSRARESQDCKSFAHYAKQWKKIAERPHRVERAQKKPCTP